MSFQVLAETDEIVVINKPSLTHSLQGRDKDSPCAESFLYDYSESQKKLPEAGLLHRLDFLTSGCLAAARTQKAFDKWIPLFRKSSEQIRKLYLAVVEGEPKEQSFDLYFHSRYKGSKQVTVDAKGDERERGRCQFMKLQGDDYFSLLQIELIGAGKRHQIRAGLSYLGHPIAGDKLYSSKLNWPYSFGLHANFLQVGELSTQCPTPSTWPFKL